MRYLLDTHVLIWVMIGSPRITADVREILENPDNVFYVSSATIWETAIKHAIKPEEIPVSPEQMIRFCRESSVRELPVRFSHSQRVTSLPAYHHDPFDRMLVAQALEENLLLMTHDAKLPPYGNMVMKI